MEKSRKTIVIAFALGMMAMGGVLAVAAFGLGPGFASAASPPTAQGTTTGKQGTTAGGKDLSSYIQLLEQNFATNLGVSQAKLDSSFTAAVSSTVDKAVQDGALTQDQANQIKANTSSGFS